jgi:CheY-like chemotaxis protein
MRVLCVGRHPFLSEHLGRFFEDLGLDCIPCVGLSEAVELVPVHQPDAVICDYDLLATMSLTSWESDPMLGDLPVIAVSLTRHPGEAHLMDVNGIAGFLYLPTLNPQDAHRLLSGLKPRSPRINPPNVLPWPSTPPVAQFR